MAVWRRGGIRYSSGRNGFLGLQSGPTVYPEWWGAVADDSTDNRTAIRAALQCLETRGGGVLSLASRGNYLITNGATPGDPGVWLTENAHDVIIEGNNAFLIGTACNGPILKLGAAYDSGTQTNKLQNIVVRGLTITGAGSDAATLASYPYQDGLYIGNSSKISIQDVYINNIARNGIAGKKNYPAGSQFWNKNSLINVKVTNVGNAGLCIGLNNHDDQYRSVVDDITMVNCCFNGLGKAYAQPDSGYTNTQAGVIIYAYSPTLCGVEIASVNYTLDTTYNDKVTSGRFTATGWTYGANWAQDATNYEADATTATSDLSQNLLLMENTTYTVSFAVRNLQCRDSDALPGHRGGNRGQCQRQLLPDHHPEFHRHRDPEIYRRRLHRFHYRRAGDEVPPGPQYRTLYAVRPGLVHQRPAL